VRGYTQGMFVISAYWFIFKHKLIF